jgi:hypothetical protein
MAHAGVTRRLTTVGRVKNSGSQATRLAVDKDWKRENLWAVVSCRIAPPDGYSAPDRSLSQDA